jgi:uncharacterized protein (DUF4415 family)
MMIGLVTASCQKWPPALPSSRQPARINPQQNIGFARGSSVTMRLSEDVVAYFKGMALEAGVPYQSLINLYLRDCVTQHRQVQIAWPKAP